MNEGSSQASGREGERFPRVVLAELDGDGVALREAMLGGGRASVRGQFPLEADDGTLEGPFGVFLFSPAIGAPLQELGARLRSRTTLTHRQRELVTLAVASELACEFELQAHLPLAESVGVSAEEVRGVLEGDTLADPLESALVSFARANARDARPAAEFERLFGLLGRQSLFEVIALVSYYRGLATMLDLFAIASPEG